MSEKTENNPDGYPWNHEQFKGDKAKWAHWWLEFHYLHHAMNDDDIETEMFCREMMKTQKKYLAVCEERDALRSAKLSVEIYRDQIEKELRTQLADAQGEIGELKCDLSTACRYLVEGKAKFTPHTTNSFVDIFIERVGKLLRAQLGDEKEL